MTTAIVPATSVAQREAVFRFRYDVYVREMGRVEPYACHARGRLTDTMDQAAWILCATDGRGRVIGTVRTNFLRSGDAGQYEDLYGLRRLSASERHAASVTTRLMTAPRHRGGALGLHLAVATYAFGLDAGIECDYIDCNAPLVEFFTRLGYRSLRRIEHPQYGAVNLMRLDLRDRDHLATMRSPFLRVLEARQLVICGASDHVQVRQ